MYGGIWMHGDAWIYGRHMDVHACQVHLKEYVRSFPPGIQKICCLHSINTSTMTFYLNIQAGKHMPSLIVSLGLCIFLLEGL